MRDQRFVARHRGGPLSKVNHQRLAAWAADCAEHLLPLFEARRRDPRPRQAIAVARAWARGEVTVGAAQKAAVAAHAAARAVKQPDAVAAARAAGHAAATAHMAEHALGPVIYGAKAVKAAGGSAAQERTWQFSKLPRGVRTLVKSAVAKRLGRLLRAM